MKASLHGHLILGLPASRAVGHGTGLLAPRHPPHLHQQSRDAEKQHETQHGENYDAYSVRSTPPILSTLKKNQNKQMKK